MDRDFQKQVQPLLVSRKPIDQKQLVAFEEARKQAMLTSLEFAQTQMTSEAWEEPMTYLTGEFQKGVVRRRSQ